MSILEKVKKQMKATNNIMEGRVKGQVKELTAYIIKDFAILKDKNNDSDYSVFVVDGNQEEFFFGGTVVTDKLKTITNLVTEEELETLKCEGIPVMFVTKKSKNKRNYVDMELL